MPYVSKEQIAQARSLDLLTYLQRYDPDELVPLGGQVYTTRSHDSLKISHGKWFWWSQGIGGRSALDYLVEVEGMTLPEAVERLNGSAFAAAPRPRPAPKPPPAPVPFVLPPRNGDNKRVIAYLASRGLDFEIINHCIKHGLLYQEKERHNAVFVGYEGKIARYAYLRGTNSSTTFMREVEGGDKRFSFRLVGPRQKRLMVFESAIDLLSYATLVKLNGGDWRANAYLSLSGVYQQSRHHVQGLPMALAQYLQEHEPPSRLLLCLDNDEAGRQAAEMIRQARPDLDAQYTPPSVGKDYNEMLQHEKGIFGKAAMRGKPSAGKERRERE